MARSSAPYVRTPFLYGLCAGLASFALILLLYHLGRHPFLIAIFFEHRILVFAIAMPLSLAEARRRNGGALYFWQGLAGVLVLTLVFIATTGGLLYPYMIIDSNFVSNFIALSIAQLKALSETDITQLGVENYRYSLSMIPKTDAALMLRRFAAQSLIIGAPIGLIVAAIMRRSPEPGYNL